MSCLCMKARCSIQPATSLTPCLNWIITFPNLFSSKITKSIYFMHSPETLLCVFYTYFILSRGYRIRFLYHTQLTHFNELRRSDHSRPSYRNLVGKIGKNWWLISPLCIKFSWAGYESDHLGQIPIGTNQFSTAESNLIFSEYFFIWTLIFCRIMYDKRLFKGSLKISYRNLIHMIPNGRG